MRARTARSATSAALGALVLLGACNRTTVPQAEPIELHRSGSQHLVLRNGSDRPASIESFEETAPTLRLEPGSGAAFDFVVATLAEAEPVPGRPWRALAPGTETNVALIEPGGYLQESGPDLVLRVRFDDEATQERRFSLQCGVDGWEAAPAPEGEHEVDLARPPLAGVPERICPMPL
jgi:hypothetical protein